MSAQPGQNTAQHSRASSAGRRSPSATPSTSSCCGRPAPRSRWSTRCATRRCRAGTAALVLPGGFPEEHVAELGANAPLRAAVAALARSGAPVHAECGGLLYLCEELDGAPMCGVLPARRRHDRAADPGLPGRRRAGRLAAVHGGGAGHRARVPPVRGDRRSPAPRCRPAWRWRGGDPEGCITGGVHASFLHTHPAGRPDAVSRFVAAAITYPGRRRRSYRPVATPPRAASGPADLRPEREETVISWRPSSLALRMKFWHCSRQWLWAGPRKKAFTRRRVDEDFTSTGDAHRPSWWASMLGAVALTASLGACSSGPQGIVINLYGGASETGFDKIIAACNEQAAGRYTIVGNLLPSDADGQRDQFVRRLAAQDAGMDILGMDVTWTAEFAEAGWIRELTPEQKAAANADTLQPPINSATWKDKQYGIAKHTNVQLLWYRKSLVPTPPTTFDEMISMSRAAQGAGQAVRDRLHRGPVRGLRGEHQQPDHRLRRHDRQRGQHRADHRRQDRAGADPAAEAGQLRADQLVAVQRPGARGVRRPAGRALGVLAELALRAVRDARGQPGPGQRPRVRPVPDGEQGRNARGSPSAG